VNRPSLELRRISLRNRPRARQRALLTVLTAVLLAAVQPLPVAGQTGQATAETAPAAQSAQPEFRQGRGENEVVLLHGLGSNAEIWNEVRPYLMGMYTVWTFELPGHGNTPPIESPDIEKMAGALHAYLKENDIAYPSLVGHGMGGLIALHYTLDHPADIDRLVMIDAGARQLATTAQKSAIVDGLMADYDYTVASRFVGVSKDSTVVQQVVDSALRTDSATFISLLTRSLDFDYSDELANHSVPVLVIGSEALFPEYETIGQYLGILGFEKVWNLNFKRIEGTGHFIMLERPTVLAQTLLSFIVSEQPR